MNCEACGEKLGGAVALQFTSDDTFFCGRLTELSIRHPGCCRIVNVYDGGLVRTWYTFSTQNANLLVGRFVRLDPGSLHVHLVALVHWRCWKSKMDWPWVVWIALPELDGFLSKIGKGQLRTSVPDMARFLEAHLHVKVQGG